MLNRVDTSIIFYFQPDELSEYATPNAMPNSRIEVNIAEEIRFEAVC